MFHRLSVILFFEKDCFTQREGPTQLLLQQKSRMPLAGLVYLFIISPCFFMFSDMAMDTQHDNITFPLPSSYQETFNKFAGVDKPRIYVPQLRAIRKRIRFTAEQLKILHSHFNIHSLPSQDEVTTMSKQTGLTERKIKNWFRNTLFKARQQDPNSPYNFSNVSSTDSNNQIRENQEKIEDSATCENPHDMETDNDKDSDKSGKDETNDVHDVAKTNMKIALVKAKMKMKLAKAKAKILCEFLERSTYPDDDVIERLAKELNVSYEAIKTWFQNNWHKNAIKNLDNQMQSPLVTSSSGSDKDEEQRESHSDNTIQNQPVGKELTFYVAVSSSGQSRKGASTIWRVGYIRSMFLLCMEKLPCSQRKGCFFNTDV